MSLGSCRKDISFLLTAIAVACTFIARAESNQDHLLVVETAQGLVHGEFVGSENNIRSFKGVPFAAPPVGELRWQAPQPVESWEGTRDVTEFAMRCPQPVIESGFYTTEPQPMSEDCLYLNVWTGATASDANLPVMVWIHGGGFHIGAGSEPIYNGTSLAEDGVILVSVNYRLGVLGFFAHPALSAESDTGSSGNQGIYDQVAALRWVNQNISNFGGDPDNVTIFGESAGSASVCYLVATPLAKGLFQKAIGQSAGCFAKHSTLTEDGDHRQSALLGATENKSGYRSGKEIAAALGASTLDASALEVMRALSPEEITAKLAEHEVTPDWRSIYVDGVLFPRQMRSLLLAGGSEVNSIVGFTHHEGTTLFMQFPELPLADFEANVHANLPKHASALLAAYEADIQESTKRAIQEMASDALFGVEMRTWAQLVSSQGKNAYLFVFNHAPPIEEYGRSLGAFHAAEIQYIFQSTAVTESVIGIQDRFDDTDHEVARLMRGYWLNFAKTGDPNGEGLPQWDAYAHEADNALMIDSNPEMVTAFRKAKFDVFENILQQGFVPVAESDE